MAKFWENRDFEVLFNSLSKQQKRLRRDIRYGCFRIQKYIVEGCPIYEDSHQLIKDAIEKLENFESWETFAITWDISIPEPLTLVKRKWSIQQEWNAVLTKVVPELTKKE